MATELPYFKFNVTEWMTGDIALESYELQGLFINICALYWKNLGVLEISSVEKRYKKKKLLEKLEEKYFSVSDGFISIKFLDEQLSKRQEVSKRDSDNGKKGGRPKKSGGFISESEPEKITKAKKSHIEIEKEIEVDKEEEVEERVRRGFVVAEKFPIDFLIEKYSTDFKWLADCAKTLSVIDFKVIKLLADFKTFLGTQKKEMKTEEDFMSHFVNWARKQKPEKLSTEDSFTQRKNEIANELRQQLSGDRVQKAS